MVKFRLFINAHFICLSVTLIFASVLLLTQNGLVWDSDVIKIFPAKLPKDVSFVHLSQNFIEEKLWPELLRITGTKINAALPELVFLKKDLSPIQIDGELVQASGQYLADKKQIEIYRFSIYQDVREVYLASNTPFQFREWNIAIYMMIAHELLHHIYYLEGYSSSLEHHNKMKQDQSLSKICDFLAKELVSDRVAKSIIERALERGIETDNKIEQLSKKSSR